MNTSTRLDYADNEYPFCIDTATPNLKSYKDQYVVFDDYPFFKQVHACFYDKATGKLKSICLDKNRYETIKREAA